MIGSSYEAESEIWAGLGRFIKLHIIFLLTIFSLSMKESKMMLDLHRDWSPKFETGLSIIIGIV